MAGMTLHLQLPRPACQQLVCSHSLSRHHSQGPRDRTRPSKHRIKPSSTPHSPLVMDTPVRMNKSFKHILVLIILCGEFLKIILVVAILNISLLPCCRAAILCWCARGSLCFPVWAYCVCPSCLCQAACNGLGKPIQSVPPATSAQLWTACLWHR